MSRAAESRRKSRAFRARPGSRHDRVVGVARRLLPAGVGALTAILALAPVLGRNEVSFVLAKDKVEITQDRLRVDRALYRGTDDRGQPFALAAGSAVQASSADPIVRLADLNARILLEDGPATLRAGTARYDIGGEQVAVDGPVLFQAADGYRLATRDVGIDLATRALRSDGAVEGVMPLGRFSADRLEANLNDRTVTLDGRVRVRIVQGSIR